MVSNMKNPSPDEIFKYIANGGFTNAGEYTYIILGKSGPTGKTWLCNKLNDHGFNAVEISEDIWRFIDYKTNGNYFIVSPFKEIVTIVLNIPIIRKGHMI